MTCLSCLAAPGGPIEHDLEVYRGDTLNLLFRFEEEDGTPVDITGLTFAASIRASNVSADATDFDVVVNASEGEVLLQLDAAVTEAKVPPTGVPTRAFWDLQQTNGVGEVSTLFRGRVHAYGDITE